MRCYVHLCYLANQWPPSFADPIKLSRNIDHKDWNLGPLWRYSSTQTATLQNCFSMRLKLPSGPPIRSSFRRTEDTVLDWNSLASADPLDSFSCFCWSFDIEFWLTTETEDDERYTHCVFCQWPMVRVEFCKNKCKHPNPHYCTTYWTAVLLDIHSHLPRICCISSYFARFRMGCFHRPKKRLLSWRAFSTFGGQPLLLACSCLKSNHTLMLRP